MRFSALTGCGCCSSRTTLVDLANLLTLASTEPIKTLQISSTLLKDRNSVRRLARPCHPRDRLYFRPVYALFVRAIEVIALAQTGEVHPAARDILLLLEGVTFPQGIHAQETVDTFEDVRLVYKKLMRSSLYCSPRNVPTIDESGTDPSPSVSPVSPHPKSGQASSLTANPCR